MNINQNQKVAGRFNVGDKVYRLDNQCTSCFVVEKNYGDRTGYLPLLVNGQGFTENGKVNPIDTIPALVHATKENRAILQMLTGIEFCPPLLD